MLGKKLLIGTVALGFSAFALANGDISYQAPPSPFSPSIYFGAKIGYSMSGWENFDTDQSGINIKNASGLALGVYAGWRFAKYFAVEGGWTPDLYTVRMKPPLPATNTIKASTQGTVELTGKLIAPFPNIEGVELYAKLGGAYMYTNRDLRNKSSGVVNLAYGVGLTWAFMPSFGVDVGWTQYHGKPEFKTSYFPTRNRFMVGLYYSIPLA